MPTQQKIKLGLLLMIMIITAFVRESFFLHVNVRIDHPEVESGTSVWSFLQDFSGETLVKLKWLATFMFIAVFFLITYFAYGILLPDIKNRWIIVAAFSGILVLAAVGMTIGWMIPSMKPTGYYFARWLVGSVQSPLLPSILLLLATLQKKKQGG